MPGPSQNTPWRLTISCITIPKEYTSPFWVPSGGGSDMRSSSGAVQSRPAFSPYFFKIYYLLTCNSNYLYIFFFNNSMWRVEQVMCLVVHCPAVAVQWWILNHKALTTAAVSVTAAVDQLHVPVFYQHFTLQNWSSHAYMTASTVKAVLLWTNSCTRSFIVTRNYYPKINFWLRVVNLLRRNNDNSIAGNS